MAHPTGSFRGGPGAVVDGDHSLRPGIRSHMHEVGKGRDPLPCVIETSTGGPMVFVRERAAREAQNLRAHFLEQGNSLGGIEVAIPNSSIHAEPARIHRADDWWRIDAEMDG